MKSEYMTNGTGFNQDPLCLSIYPVRGLHLALLFLYYLRMCLWNIYDHFVQIYAFLTILSVFLKYRCMASL